MPIISPLTYTIQNGQAVDATPVMSDLNQIVSSVNANAAALAGSSSQVFNAAPATTNTEVVTLGQVALTNAQVFGFTGGTTANTSYGQTLTFTVGNASQVSVMVSYNNNSLVAFGDITTNILIDGVLMTTEAPSSTNSWCLMYTGAFAAGTHTILAEYVIGATAIGNSIYIRGIAIVSPAP